jgi:hypothetical protein
MVECPHRLYVTFHPYLQAQTGLMPAPECREPKATGPLLGG